MRLGVLLPSTNVAVEEEFRAFAPPDVVVHAARAYLVETTIQAEEQMLAEHVNQAALDLGTIHPDVVVFNCTTATAILGAAGERQLIGQLERATGAPVVTTNKAVHHALHDVGAQRVAVLTPYIDELTARVAQGVGSLGMEVTVAAGLGVVDPYAISEIDTETIIEFVRASVHGFEVDTVFLSCANLRAFPIRELLEEITGLHVVTSNHAALKRALMVAGQRESS